MSCIRIAIVLVAGLSWIAPAACAAESVSPPSSGKAAAERLVQSALAAELQGDVAGHKELLAEALEADGANPAANWQSGRVFYQKAWLSLAEAAERARRDKLLADYREMRGRLGDSADAQRVLARRCQKNGLTDLARAHASRLHELDPDDAEALRILGLSWYQGMLLTPEQIAQRKQRDEKAKQALRYWQPIVLDIRRQIDSEDEKQSAAGWQALREIHDPSAIEALEAVFSKYRHGASLEVVKVIGRMNTPAATDSLLRHALLSKREDVRLAACQQLRGQSPVAYVPRLISSLTAPAQTRFEVVGDPDEVRFREVVERQDTSTKEQQVRETRVPLYIPNPNLANIVNAAAINAFQHSQETAGSIKGSKSAERQRQQMNSEIYWVLENATGQSLPQNPDAWYVWWRQQNYMPINPKKVLTYTNPQYVDVPYVNYIPPSIPIYSAIAVGIGNAVAVGVGTPTGHAGCFALGTKVWTLTGPVAIEKLEVGDEVLSQDPFTGELTYKPVLKRTVGHQELLSIDVGDEKLVPTYGHVLWVSGKGWRMAADLTAGDRLHTVDGWKEIVAIDPIPAADTRNLIVADYGTYFVGDNRVLVHDVTMLQPYAGKVPGDKPAADLAAQ